MVGFTLRSYGLWYGFLENLMSLFTLGLLLIGTVISAKWTGGNLEGDTASNPGFTTY